MLLVALVAVAAILLVPPTESTDAVDPTSITVELKTGSQVYTSTTPEQLAEMLIVRDQMGAVLDSGYVVDNYTNPLTPGINQFTVRLTDNPDIFTTISLNVQSVYLSSLEVTQSISGPIYVVSDIVDMEQQIRDKITVVAHYSDGSVENIENYTLGFAQSPNRLNVALSRAKRLLVIVGNEKHFSQHPIYEQLFKTIRNNPNNKVIEQSEL